MDIKLACHQPNYFPWAGYFRKMSEANLFVILDTVPYSKNSYINRVKIRGDKWLTIPIQQKFGQIIRDVRLCDIKEPQHQIELIKQAYQDATYFDYFSKPLFRRMSVPWKFLSTLNTSLIMTVARMLGIPTGITQSSFYDFKKTGDDLLIEICRHFKATTYLSGVGGKKYQDENKFKEAGIKIEYPDYNYPDISILDSLFYYGNNYLHYD